MLWSRLSLLFLGGLLLALAGWSANANRIQEEALGDAHPHAVAESVDEPIAADIAVVTATPQQLARRERLKSLVVGLTVFVLAVFVGFEVIAKVPPTLHTPLMSGSNAISGITVVGAAIIAGHELTLSFSSVFSSLAGMLAVALAMINVIGGFLVTHRMLAMFKRR